MSKIFGNMTNVSTAIRDYHGGDYNGCDTSDTQQNDDANLLSQHKEQ